MQLKLINLGDYEYFTQKNIDKISIAFLQIVNIIIYEKNEEIFDNGFKHLQKYLASEYESYQHILILKSCTDLVKFNIKDLINIEKNFIKPIDEKDSYCLPKCFYILY